MLNPEGSTAYSATLTPPLKITWVLLAATWLPGGLGQMLAIRHFFATKLTGPCLGGDSCSVCGHFNAG